MKFYKKDLMLVFGCALLGIGMAVYLAPILSIIIASAIFILIKAFFNKSSSALLNATKGGICVQCGQRLDECVCDSQDAT